MCIAAARTDTLAAGGDDKLTALVGGYHLAFIVGAIFAASAAVVGALLFRESTAPQHAGALEPAQSEY